MILKNNVIQALEELDNIQGQTCPHSFAELVTKLNAISNDDKSLLIHGLKMLVREKSIKPFGGLDYTRALFIRLEE